MRTLHMGAHGREQWTVNVSDQSDQVTAHTVAHLIEFVQRWATTWCELHPNEPTAARREFGVPSLIVRMDYLHSQVADPFIFELEERPQGAGLAWMLSKSFRARFDPLKKRWPHFCAVIAPERRGGDDYIWVPGGEVSLDSALQQQDGVIVRCEPHQEQFWALEQRSLSTVKTEGNKQYGVTLGLWQTITRAGALPSDRTGFAIKPPAGSKCAGLFIYHPTLYRVHGAGAHSYDRVRREAQAHIDKFGFCYLQPFAYPPEKEHEGRRLSVMHRLFFGWDPRSKEWLPLGGNWVSRPAPCARIHGSSDGCSGPLLLP